jgi:phosphatidylinositol alpha-mannosyltransferase
VRVGLVCPYSLDVDGGVQAHVLQLAGALSRLGHDVAVLAPGERTPALPSYVTTTGRTVPLAHNGSVARVAFGPVVAGRVGRWLHDGDFDVLHLHEPATPSLSALALRAARAPVVATVHTAQERAWALRASGATLLRAPLAKVSATIAVSPQARATLARYADVPAVVIPNGVDVDRFATAAQPERSRGALVFVGRVDEPRKGLSVLLTALPAVLDRHPGVHVRVVGAGAARLPSVDRRLAGRVELTGRGVAGGSGVLVAPNLGGESFGVVLVEAMAAGAAVVASDLPAFRRVLRSGAAGLLCPPGDPAALAAAVGDVLADPVRRAALTRRASEVVRGYDWSVVAPRVAEVYEACAGPRSRVAGNAAG